MIDWINSWKSGNKKNKYNLTLRAGRLTILEFKLFFIPKEGGKAMRFRFMLLNFGFDI
jgi:hypothetical protein